jgi:predicted dehydrogenase
MDSIRMGIVGYGYWGPNLARNFYELPSSQLVAIADLKDDQLKRAKSRYPGVVLTTDYQELFKMDLDAVVISTPPKTHFKVAKDCLLHDLNILVEKPLTLTSCDGEELIQIADDRQLTLMVGHTFEYNSAVLAMKKYIERKELGDLYYIDTARLNLGLFQRDSNVLWDLAPHDISILLYLLDENPISVSAQGMPCVIPGVYDVAYLSLIFPHNLTAYVHVSWLDPCKVRRVTVVGSKKMAVYNDMETEGKIKIYDKGIDAPDYTNGFGEFEYNYRSGDINMPNIRFTEPLLQECQHFVDSIINHTEPKSSGRNGLRVVKILEAAQRSLTKSATHELIPW